VMEQVAEAGNTNMALPANAAPGSYMLRFDTREGNTFTTRLVYKP
jgi:hypothetical protein